MLKTLTVAITVLAAPAVAQTYRPPVAHLEPVESQPLPPGFGIQHTDVDGPVFTDRRGMTLYVWPARGLRNGDAGEQPGRPMCDDAKYTASAGLAYPYPPGLILPDAAARPTCSQVWPPAYAEDDAQPVGEFTVVKRKDGRRQWAYKGYALYTSALDTRPGQTNGATSRSPSLDSPALRKPVGPHSRAGRLGMSIIDLMSSPGFPPAFSVRTVATGRLLTLATGASVYMWDGDATMKSNCRGDCLSDWTPVLAGEFSLPQGEWGIVERSPGVKQWAFRGRPLYTYPKDQGRLQTGSDVPGWRNVYLQENPDPPADFTIQDWHSGQVLADRNGKTVYIYICGEDVQDQLPCDHPTTTQMYRLAVCGNGNVDQCNKTWPYVLASPNAVSKTLIWRAAWIDPQSGRFTESIAPGALYVWTFRDRPVYTFAGDDAPGDVEGDAWGEWVGYRNGFKAFFLRDDFQYNAE